MNLSEESKINLRWPALFIHLTCWVIFICYELTLLYSSSGKLEPAINYLFYYALNILYFYAFAALLRITFNRSRPLYLVAAFSLSGLFIVYLLLKSVENYWLSKEGAAINHSFSFTRIFPSIIFRSLYFTMLALFYWASGYIFYYRRRASAAERQELVVSQEKANLSAKFAVAENAFLRQQINPHLLFNTLNFVYNKVDDLSPAAGRCILLLSEILRFGICNEKGEEKVLLTSEIEQLNNLVEINQYRFDNKLNLKIDFEGAFEKLKIVPLVLLTLTENIFKHGDLRDPENPGIIRINADPDGHLIYYCRNTKKYSSGEKQVSNTGLNNLRVRLDFAYPENYHLKILDQANYFELTLHLLL